VYEPHERAELADELADAFLTAPWKPAAVAESGAGCLDRWPPWLESLAVAVVAVFRAPPSDRRDELVTIIETFLAEHTGWP
jgi:hypothetical protein